MPSNTKLIESIEAEAKAKGVDIPVTEDLNNSQLADKLKELKALAPAPAPAPAETSEAPAPVVEKKAPYTMAPNKAITTLKGVLADGDEVKVEYLADGEDGLKRHVENGNVIEN